MVRTEHDEAGNLPLEETLASSEHLQLVALDRATIVKCDEGFEMRGYCANERRQVRGPGGLASGKSTLRELWPAIDYNTPSRRLLAGFELYGIDTACIANSKGASQAVGARCARWKLQNCVVPSEPSLVCRWPFSPGGSTQGVTTAVAFRRSSSLQTETGLECVPTRSPGYCLAPVAMLRPTMYCVMYQALYYVSAMGAHGALEEQSLSLDGTKVPLRRLKS